MISNLLVCIPLLPPFSRRRQEVDRVHDGHSLHTFLRAEIHRPDSADYLSGEIRRIHVTRLQRAHRDAAIGFDRQAQHHLSFQSRVIAQLPVVQPVERCLVAVEHNLYFFVGSGRSHSAARLRPVAAGDRGDRTGPPAYAHASQSAAATAATSSASTDSATAVATTTASSATATDAAV